MKDDPEFRETARKIAHEFVLSCDGTYDGPKHSRACNQLFDAVRKALLMAYHAGQKEHEP